VRLRANRLALLLVASLATGCSGDPQADYCDTVEDHQVELTDIAASEDAGALFDALPVYDDLADDAPQDIADDWAAVIEPLRALEKTLSEAGVDPSSYAADEPPADLDDADREAIEAAARGVGSEATVTAMAAVEQHALDVCGTPLSR
jgi:hypothetical protein